MSNLDRVLQCVNMFAASKVVVAIRDGIVAIGPFVLVGSMFLLIINIPILGYQEFMTNIFGNGWKELFYQVIESTFEILAIIVVFGITSTYVQNEGFYGVPAGLLAIVCLFIMNNHFVKVDDIVVFGVLPKEFLGGQGIIGAILLGLFVGYVYSLCLKYNLKITLPEEVPPGVATAFSNLIPFMIVITIMAILFVLIKTVFNQTFLEVVYKILQIPLQHFSSSLIGAFLIPILVSLLWWTGMNGGAIISGILGPILMANSIANQKLMDNAEILVTGDNAYIVTAQYFDQYISVTGSGFTLGLAILMLFRAKSPHYKEVGKSAFMPGLFNINEPILFGTPIVFNPYMLIPFILAPLSSSLIVYTAISTGFLAPFGAILVPWTTPIIIGGLIIGGPKAAFVQLVCLVVTIFIYFPFFRLMDKQAMENEKQKVCIDHNKPS
ncbi:MAG: PTS sugar transporter subunit IIC [Brevinema sp.]